MNIIKILKNGRVISALVSALGAAISAICAGCKLYIGEIAVKDYEAEIFSAFNTITNSINEVK